MKPGYIAALILAGLTMAGIFAGAFVLLFVGLIGGTGESDRYGRVEIPGIGSVELPGGEVTVFYEQRDTLADDESLTAPRGLEYEVRPASGGPALEEHAEGFLDEHITVGGVVRTNFAEIEVPAEGRYAVRTTLRGVRPPTPALTFGEPLTNAILDEVKKVLYGLLGFALAALIALATFLHGRLRHEDERVTMPPGGPGAGADKQ